MAGVCAFSKAPAGDAFAMTFGGGLDIPIGHKVSFRLAEIDIDKETPSKPRRLGNEIRFPRFG